MEMSKTADNPNGIQQPKLPLLRLTLTALRLYQGCDRISGLVIYFMMVFSPWAFGTTEAWSISTMNGLGYLLGALLAIKLAIRWLTGFRHPQWGDRSDGGSNDLGQHRRGRRFLTRSLAILTVLIVGYCALSALNARSCYRRAEAMFDYFHYLSWLPHSYDRGSTWQAFFNYLALALFFWALGDWLAGKTSREQRDDRERAKPGGLNQKRTMLPPERLRTFLWVLSINGGLLALEGIIQRLNGTPKLLFLIPAHVHKEAVLLFGPYAYRSNAAQYFNLVWPVSLGFWWTLRRAVRNGAEKLRKAKSRWMAHHLILISVMLMAVCPIISTTRAGAFVAIASMLAAAVILWSALRKEGWTATIKILIFLGLTLGFAAWVGWKDLAPRFDSDAVQQGFIFRNSMYETARSMAEEHPLFGTGPGTFEPLFQMYRTSLDEYWPAQLHNDWLETLITFGWVGCILIGLALITVLFRWFVRGGIPSKVQFVMLFWVALAGCLFHARFDYPFQVYSILHVFLALCAVLFALSRARSR